MLNYEPFELSTEASGLACHAITNLTGKKQPKPLMSCFVYSWSPQLQQIVEQVVKKDLVCEVYMTAKC